jgi:enoyl-[acyl-carrier protein] reductase I
LEITKQEFELLQDKVALVFGVANKRSIAWAIAQSLAGAGARVALTYQERVGDTVKELAATLPNAICLPCDVQSDSELEATFGEVGAQMGGLDILVHSVAFAPREALDGRFLDTTRQAFQMALDISAYSLVPMVKLAVPMMEKRGGGSVITMTYGASQKVVEKYNVMAVAKAALETEVRYLAYEVGTSNVRVNAISAGPVSTLAARGISGFSRMMEHVRTVAPLRRGTDSAEVGDVALFLSSPMARGITGQIVYCDSGHSILMG